MNEMPIEPNTNPSRSQGAPARKKKGPLALLIFVFVWLLLIGSGVYGAKWYTEQKQLEITSDIERQTTAQVTAMQQAYEERITQLETSYTAEISELKGKVDALNELLTFTKDNADSKTDNSNMLYTQLNEVKKQLNELKKSLDVLK